MLLSICIPTYNRQNYLKESVSEILRQIPEDFIKEVEICISDNNSSDNTKEYVDQILSNSRVSIKYRKNTKNLGPDWNFINAMQMASGKFSWLMGDDDFINDNALLPILNLLNGPDIFDLLLFNRIDCDINLKPVFNRYCLREDIDTQIFDFGYKLQECYYYSLCRNLCGVFSFISGYIYKTEAVVGKKIDEVFIGTSYSFLFLIFNYLRDKKRVLYLKDHLILCRTGNDSHGVGFKRALLDFKGYLLVKDVIFKEAPEGIDFINVLKYERPFSNILYLYCISSHNEWVSVLKPLLIRCGWADKELEFVEKIGSAPNWYQSRLKQRIRQLLGRKDN
jgi:abequosyltransferase